jgi:hypothetical protein
MKFSQKNSFISAILGVIIVTGCVKFDDPTLSNPPAPEDYSSPCTNELSDNEAEITSTNGLAISTFTFSSPFCSDTDVDCNPNVGSFEIILSQPVTESRTFVLDFPVIDFGEAQIRFQFSNEFLEPTFHSTSGTLYADVQPDGSVIFEWCDIPCQSNSTGGLIRVTSGKAVCN